MTNSTEVAGQTVIWGNSEDMSALPDGSADLIVTSPPYWNLKDYGHRDQIGASSYEVYLDRLNNVWRQCYEKSTQNAVLAINVNNRRVKKRFYPIALDVYAGMTGWTLWDTIIWYVPNALPQPNHYMERLFDNKYEFVLIFTKGFSQDYKFHKPRVPQKYIEADPRAHKKNGRGRCLGNVIRIPAYRPPNVKQLGYHEAAFPEELVALLIEAYTDPGDTVLDPFLGSGTTLKVSRVMGRHGSGYELNAGYSSLIRKRIQEHWEVPDWRQIDLIHSTTMEPGMKRPRKVHFARRAADSQQTLL